MIFAEIAIALPVDGLYTYRIPDHMRLQVGHAVLVPFGRQKVSGYVIKLTDETSHQKVKFIDRLLDPYPAFEARMLPFFIWIAKYYLAGLGEVISTALPKNYKAKTTRVYVTTEKGIDALANLIITNRTQEMVLREIISKPGRSQKGIIKIFLGELEDSVIKRALEGLLAQEYIRYEEKVNGGAKAMITTVSLTKNPADRTKIRGPRMLAAVNALEGANGSMDVNDIVQMEGPTIRPALKRLESKGIVIFNTRESREQAKFAVLPASSKPHAANAEQQKALDAICNEKPQPYLLHGVTGSGKTEVYLQAAQTYSLQGQQTLILVPEIALTPLLIGRVKARFGDKVAALHSGLRPSERIREWRRIRAGEVDVAVGARSALFAPFPNLGLIIVDEEHDDSYKQGDGLRYHARDLAVLRGKFEECPVVLGSATPSLETWNNAQEEKYTLLRMANRATPKPLPDVQLIDMRGRPPIEIISPELTAALTKCFAENGKAIVLFNRRGYAPSVECPGCGGFYQCPSCGINLVLHKQSHKLSCHYCGFFRNFQQNCPQCNTTFDIMGYGSERVEEELQRLFPTVGIARMDADTVSTRGSHHRILDRFRTGEANLLVGTQLVAKGHDFPNVTLAAVVGVDHILTLPDFRSAERTYALITQLAGRAGRGSNAGKVIVQTRHPDHFVFRLSATKEIEDPDHVFYLQESRQRKILKYPPFTRMILIKIEGVDRAKTRETASALARKLRSSKKPDIEVLGPVLAPMSKLIGRWRFQLILRSNNIAVFRSWIEQSRDHLKRAVKGGVRVSWDVDPRNLL